MQNASTPCPFNASRCGVDFRTGQELVVSLYGGVFLLGLATNALTLWPIVQQVRLGNVLAVYLLGLAASDLLYLLTLPLWVLYVWHEHHWPLSRLACHAAGFVFYSNMYVSVLLLCLISLERYLAVAHPLRSLGLRSRRAAATASALVALLVFIFHLGVSLHSQDLSSASCYDSYPLQPGVARFNYFRVAAGFALPLVILGVSYLKIFQGVRASSSLVGWQKAKVKRLSLGVIAIFLLCFAPYHLLLLVRTVASTVLDRCALCAFERRLHLPFSLALALSSLNSALDPVLYALVSDSIKGDLRKAFGCVACTRSPASGTATSLAL
ncbi:probable G-protein coupled receptor 132 [Emydura macquarii macquarii]|uniref:probable G-protein coupled receptor 132 n=1 Tax=Emydura macquarii macquarii TaxID=1129001 RepID=UPI00352A1EC0